MRNAPKTQISSLGMSVPRWRSAAFYRPDGEALICELCPHLCRLADGELGLCRVRRRRGAEMETATFATSVRHLDTVERKPFYHYRPGSRTLTLAAPGCSFTCHYCQNYRLSQYGRENTAPWSAQPIDVARIVDEAADGGAVAVALSYSEPSLAAEMTLDLANASGLDIIWKSNGYLTPEAARRLAPALAAVNIDLKSVDEAAHRALTGASCAPVLETLAIFREHGVWVETSTPLIPKINAAPDALRRIADAVAAIDPEIPWHLLRFQPEFRMRKARPTSVEALRAAVEIGHDAGLRYVYVERALGEEGRRTMCPSCGATVIERGIWECIAVHLHQGACPHCGEKIAGRWEMEESR